MLSRTSCFVGPLFALLVVGSFSARAEFQLGYANPPTLRNDLDFTGPPAALELESAPADFTVILPPPDLIPGTSTAVSQSPATAADWDYLWRNASCVPIAAIPEPSAVSLIASSAAVWLGWRQKRRKG